MIKKSKLIFSSFGVILFLGASVANAALITVDPADQQGWFVKGSNTGTGGLTVTNPHGTGGTGSLELNTDGSAGQIVQAARVPVPLVTTVADFTAISWDVYTDNTTSTLYRVLVVNSIRHFSL